MANEKSRENQRRYDAKCMFWNMRLKKDTDADVIEWLKSQANATATIKAFIRSNIAQKNKNKR